MLRKIVSPTQRKVIIDIPESYVKHKLEVLVFPIDEAEEGAKPRNAELELTTYKCQGKKADFHS